MSPHVPSKDYAAHYRSLWTEIAPELERVFHEENPIMGASVDAFEREFADYLGAQHVIGVGSGTDALILALRCLGIGPGDEVLTAANTFAATLTAILSVGARPVLVEPDPESWTIDPARVEAAITERTKAVIPVHLYGRLCDMSRLVPMCAEHGLPIIEDAAQAHGARAERTAGTFGKFGCFSFHPSKNLGAFGDGGAIATDDAEASQRLRELRNLGKRGKHEFVHVASNSKLDTLQAAVLRIKLRHLDAWNAQRVAHATTYYSELSDLPELQLPSPTVAGAHVFHLFAIHLDQRDALRAHLASHDVRGGLHYPTPPHLQPMAADLGYVSGDFPIAEASARRQLSLPIAPELSTDQIRFACGRIRDFFSR